MKTARGELKKAAAAAGKTKRSTSGSIKKSAVISAPMHLQVPLF
jgi:hypothetical protein